MNVTLCITYLVREVEFKKVIKKDDKDGQDFRFSYCAHGHLFSHQFEKQLIYQSFVGRNKAELHQFTNQSLLTVILVCVKKKLYRAFCGQKELHYV